MAAPPTNESLVTLLEVLDGLKESLIITDAEIDPPGPRILYANAAFLKMTGYRWAEVDGLSPRFLQGPKTDRRVLDRLRHCLKQGIKFEGETFNYRKDGTPFLMRWYIDPIRGTAGEPTHFFAIQRDVTAEVAASKQQRALEQAVSQSADAILLFGRDGRVRYCNASYKEWSGLREEMVIGTKAWHLPGAPPLRKDLHWARKRLQAGEDWQREYSLPRGSNEVGRFVFVTISPVRDAEGDVAEYVAVGRDITTRRRLETIAEAHNFHDNLGVVFSGIRHELGNPINSVKSALSLIQGSFETMGKEKLRIYLGQMGEEIARVEFLLRSLRSYSLYDNPRPEELDLSLFLERFQRLAERDMDRQGVDFRIHLSPGLDTAWGDPQALHQVLFNLIGNASSAVAQREDGKVTIWASQANEHVSLVVQDNGPGIPGDHLPHVFKPFYTTRPGGTGLGLAISRHLLSLMRGSIELESSARGTLVRILLDRQAPRVTE